MNVGQWVECGHRRYCVIRTPERLIIKEYHNGQFLQEKDYPLEVAEAICDMFGVQ